MSPLQWFQSLLHSWIWRAVAKLKGVNLPKENMANVIANSAALMSSHIIRQVSFETVGSTIRQRLQLHSASAS
jgi:hypothetical protein